MGFVYDDGGRSACGFRGKTGDCFVRAAAIAADLNYRETYNLTRRTAKKRGQSSPRSGVERNTSDEIMKGLGWTWVPTMEIGSGCRVHLRAEELPQGRLICRVSRHWVAVIDGVVHDNNDPSRGGSRCVYGYWHKEGEK